MHRHPQCCRRRNDDRGVGGFGRPLQREGLSAAQIEYLNAVGAPFPQNLCTVPVVELDEPGDTETAFAESKSEIGKKLVNPGCWIVYDRGRPDPGRLDGFHRIRSPLRPLQRVPSAQSRP